MRVRIYAPKEGHIRMVLDDRKGGTRLYLEEKDVELAEAKEALGRLVAKWAEKRVAVREARRQRQG